METSLRDKAKDFGAVHRSYESIAKHNQVRGPSWRGGNEPDPDMCVHMCAHALGRNAAGFGGGVLYPSWAAPSLSKESDAGWGEGLRWGIGDQGDGMSLPWQWGC